MTEPENEIQCRGKLGGYVPTELIIDTAHSREIWKKTLADWTTLAWAYRATKFKDSVY